MHYDVVVVGAGHAGCEAAAAAARLGRRVGCITLSRAGVARLSCNPAIGGLAKGHLVRELDALGGLMARAADATTVQFRHLNTRKGLAVRSSRAQVDLHAYPRAMAALLHGIPGLDILEGEVTGLRVRNRRVVGVRVGASDLDADAVVLTTGTFLTGVLHCGDERTAGGRAGDGAAHALSGSLRDLGLQLTRLKTGTVPRLDRTTIDWSQVPVQDDTVPDGRLSFADVPRTVGPLAVHVTHTTPQVHDLIREALPRSPLYSGRIEGVGPRYCPSVEDKVVRFPDRARHLLFLEPEGHGSERVYLGGLSTSLPRDVQDEIVRAIPGLRTARILQHGYAVEYDVADPRDLGPDLQHRDIPGLYLAGQVNGTSGYEEAAVQGFVAGVSAARGEPLTLGRHEAYIGVLIDDLTTRGVGGEPYRMFTSRAEHRLLLREDNADRRLMPRGRALGLVDDTTWAAFEGRAVAIDATRRALDASVAPDAGTCARFDALALAPPRKPVTWAEVLRRPDVDWHTLTRLAPHLPDVDDAVAEAVTTDVKYAGYVTRAERRAASAARLEGVTLPDDIDWHTWTHLSSEVRERLTRARPRTLGQIRRMPGVTPAAVHVVASWLAKQAAARPSS